MIFSFIFVAGKAMVIIMDWKTFRAAYIELRDTLTDFFKWLASLFSGEWDWKNPNLPI